MVIVEIARSYDFIHIATLKVQNVESLYYYISNNMRLRPNPSYLIPKIILLLQQFLMRQNLWMLEW